jgi:hypothetical protein
MPVAILLQIRLLTSEIERVDFRWDDYRLPFVVVGG